MAAGTASRDCLRHISRKMRDDDNMRNDDNTRTRHIYVMVLTKALLMSTHHICFHGEIRKKKKNDCLIPLLSGPMAQ